jgi:mono/diheme cytochrome c family protein
MEPSNPNKSLGAATAFLTAFFVCAALIVLLSDHAGSTVPQLTEGARIYTSACAACHGPDGKGTSQAIAGFERPDSFPDFSRCDQTTSELNSAYAAVITYGGPYRGFSQIMPSFSKALTPQQIDTVVHYLRSLCQSAHWPRGELNLPRAVVTEKAYPEDEEVVTAEVNARGAPGVTNHIIHEQRFGMKNQLEVDVPLTFKHEDLNWYGGVGDVTIGWKRVIYSSLQKGSIFSLQGEVSAPTGNHARDLGSGTTAFGTFAMYDQMLPANTFLQFQGGANLPVNPGIEPQNVYGYATVGHSFAGDHGFGRLWSPMVEFLANRELEGNSKTDWDVLPQMQVTLSRRQHIRGNLGLRIPVTDTHDRPIQVEFYVLWDWADGKLTEGW